MKIKNVKDKIFNPNFTMLNLNREEVNAEIDRLNSLYDQIYDMIEQDKKGKDSATYYKYLEMIDQRIATIINAYESEKARIKKTQPEQNNIEPLV